MSILDNPKIARLMAEGEKKSREADAALRAQVEEEAPDCGASSPAQARANMTLVTPDDPLYRELKEYQHLKDLLRTREVWVSDTLEGGIIFSVSVGGDTRRCRAVGVDCALLANEMLVCALADALRGAMRLEHLLRLENKRLREELGEMERATNYKIYQMDVKTIAPTTVPNREHKQTCSAYEHARAMADSGKILEKGDNPYEPRYYVDFGQATGIGIKNS